MKPPKWPSSCDMMHLTPAFHDVLLFISIRSLHNGLTHDKSGCPSKTGATSSCWRRIQVEAAAEVVKGFNGRSWPHILHRFLQDVTETGSDWVWFWVMLLFEWFLHMEKTKLKDLKNQRSQTSKRVSRCASRCCWSTLWRNHSGASWNNC